MGVPVPILICSRSDSSASLRGAEATKQSRAALETGLLRFARNDEMKSRSRGAPWRPSYATSLLEIVTTGHSRSQNGVLRTPMPVVHADVPQANARWKALFQRDFGMDCRIRSGNDEREERKKKYRRRNADRRKALLPCLTGTAAPGAPGAHLSAFHRGSRPKESFIARDSAPGFYFLGRGGQGWPVRRAGVTRSYLSQSSEVIAPRS